MELSEIMINRKAEDAGDQAIIAQISDEIFAIDLSSILSIENIDISEISTVDQEPVISLREMVIPLVYLDKLFDIQTSDNEKSNIIVVVCKHDDKCFGLVVDSLVGQKEIINKSLGILGDNEFFSGASILEDKLALVLDVGSFVA
ncbi:chemotaxis protein CheW [Butyrivibrio fibrisolvens]|jgi:two-component system chemotaxis sensor kinase CheA|uniref:chemotaxis protein CheW n=1 Tax=Butyrivibrio fibrisolvens TaxID=831 RepID=UPI0003F4AD8A|nr:MULTISPECIES: chemotaxis protein CheW [Butyrivibrio]